MPMEDTVRSLRVRMPWSVASRIMRQNGIDRSRGWDRTVAKLNDPDNDNAEHEDALAEALEEHLLCGEKLIRLYSVDDDDRADLLARIEGLAEPDNDFAEAYPTLLAEGTLADFRGHPPYFTASSTFESGQAVVLSSARYLTTRESVLPAELPAEAAAELADFAELIGVKHQRLQGVDVLWIPADGGPLQLRVDYPFGMQQRQGDQAADNAVARFAQLLGRDFLVQPVNLFPLVQRLYAATGDGMMVELGFVVSGSSQKLEKTRRGEECCREEAYHLGGVSALDEPIQPFLVSVMWSIAMAEDLSAKPEVTLRGRASHTADLDPFLGEMVVRNAVGFEDYDHVLGRLLHHLADDGDGSTG